MSETATQTDFDFDPVGASRPAGHRSAGFVEGVPDLSIEMSLAETLDTVLRVAWRAFGADGAGILLVGEGGIASAAASGADARQADCLQIDHHEGPGLQAMRGRQPVLSPSLRFDSRWRFWAPLAAHLGFHSVLSLALVDDDAAFGALTLYSDRPSNFGTELLAPGLEFIQQASLAIAAAIETEQKVRPTAFRNSSVRHQAAS